MGGGGGSVNVDLRRGTVTDLEFFSWGCETFLKYILNCAKKLLIEIVVKYA